MLAEAPALLQTRRLLLRRWQAEDFAAFAAVEGDERVTAGSGRRTPIDAAFMMMREGAGSYAVVCAADREVVASAGLYENSLTRGLRCLSLLELSYSVRFDRWGNGFASEAGEALLAAAFGAMRADGVLCGAFADNAASLRVMEKLGFRYLFSRNDREREERIYLKLSDSAAPPVSAPRA